MNGVSSQGTSVRVGASTEDSAGVFARAPAQDRVAPWPPSPPPPVGATGPSRLSGPMVLLLIVLSFAFLPERFYTGISSGLDPSWAIALHRAVLNTLDHGALPAPPLFGDDVFFTFGPLGIVATRLPIGPFAPLILAFDLFFFLNVVSILADLIRRLPSHTRQPVLRKVAIGALTLGVLLHSLMLSRLDPPCFLLLFVLFWVMKYQDEGSVLFLLFAGASAVLSFFLKMHTGILAVVLLSAEGIRLIACERRFRRGALLLLFLALGIGGGSLLLRVDLGAYLETGAALARSYPEAMWLVSRRDAEIRYWSALACGGAAAVILVAAFTSRRPGDGISFAQLLRCGSLMLVLMLVWRQGSIRADAHVRLIPHLLLPFAAIASAALPRGRSILLAIGFFAQLLVADEAVLGERWFARFAAPVRYLQELRHGVAAEPPPLNARLTPEMRERIGSSPVDVIPWELSVVHFEQLNYRPRGVLQSYAAYDPVLDRRGARKLESEGEAPPYILVHPGVIDSRAPLADEPFTKLALLTHYDPVMRSDRWLLLARRAEPATVHTSILESGGSRAELGALIPLPGRADQLIIFSAAVEYSPEGHARRFLDRPPGLHLVFTFTDGSKRTFRGIVPQLREGILISPLGETLLQLESFYRRDPVSLPTISGVEVDSKDREQFVPSFRYRIEGVTFGEN